MYGVHDLVIRWLAYYSFRFVWIGFMRYGKHAFYICQVFPDVSLNIDIN